MAAVNNFNTHVSEIIRPVMKELGFSKKNLNFRRQNGKYYESVNIQRSRYNSVYPENQFYINLYWYKNNDYSFWFYEKRLPNRPLIECPERYKAHLAYWTSEPRPTFSESERAEILNYREATLWKYKNEAELTTLLNTLAEILKEYANKIFNGMEELFDEAKIFGSEENFHYEYNKELEAEFKKLIEYCVL